MADLAELGYEASLRSLDKQEQLVGELRSRTGLLLAASSLAVAVLGRPTFDADPIPLGILALAAFATSVAASLFVLMPRRDLVFSLTGSDLYERLFDLRKDLPEVHRRLAYDLDRFWEENDRAIGRLSSAFRVAAWAVAAEVVLLLVSAGGTLL